MKPENSAPDAAAIAAVDAAITSRRSVRAYLPDAVPREAIDAILSVASRAPSGTNAQPWHVHVLTGPARQQLSAAILEAYRDPDAAQGHYEEYAYYPKEWFSPYLDRRRKVGWDLYGLLRIEKGDKEKISAQNARNYAFFDAPVGLIFTIDRRLGQGSWLDYGMFLQNIMIAARARGLDTCPQAAFTRFHRVISTQLSLPAEQMVVCGMSLGWADPAAVENSLATEREAVAQFTRYIE